MKDPKHVAPTLQAAIRQLAALPSSGQRGFVFVRPDGTERFCAFSELCDEAERRAADLHALGMKKGDRLAIVVPEPDEFVLSFLGAVMGGIVPVPIYPQLSFKNVESYHDTVTHIANASGASMLLTTGTTKQYVDPVLPRAPSLKSIVTVDEIGALGGHASRKVEVTVDPEDLAFLQFTSGSTSRPKGVVVTHRNLAWNSESFMIHGLEKDSSFDKGVSWLPLFHDMGLIGFVIGPLFTNIPVVFMPTASFVRNPRIWLDKIHQHRGTITYAPNFAYALVTKRVKEKDLGDLDLSCLRRAGCGAEPIQSKTLREFADKLKPAKFDARAFLPSYGMAEATLAITFVPAFSGVRTDWVTKDGLEKGVAQPAPVWGPGMQQEMVASSDLVNCGHAFPEHEIAIVDEQGKRLADRQVGQIITRGPSISRGYYQEPDLTAESFKPGPDGETWLYTGDLGYMIAGEVFICGRLKDMIIVRGRNFYPSDLEWLVSEMPGVRRGNVVAFSADIDGEEQLVIAAEGASAEAETLKATIAQKVVADFSLTPHEVVIVPQGTLPRTSSGKPQRRKTRQMYLDGTLARARTVQGLAESTEDAGASA